MNQTLELAIVLVPALVIAIVFHEVAHGLVARMLGDPTAQEQRRLSLNPLRHVDPVGTILVPGMLALAKGPVFGWAKPVPVNKWRLRNPRFGMVAVAAAGPATNLVLALVGAILLGFAYDPAQFATAEGPGLLVQGLLAFLTINIFLAFFNLLPIPPFDGSHIVEGLMPPAWAEKYEKLRPFGMVLFFGLVALTWFAPQWDVIGRTVGPPVEWILGQYLAITDWVAGLG